MVGPGDLLEDRYSLGSLLARGGMADVFRALDLVLQRPVAVKAFRPGVAVAGVPGVPGGVAAVGDAADVDGDDVDARRFEREARVLAGLGHPNLVQLFDAGCHDDASFLVLELVEGPSLAERLVQGPLDPADARQVGCDLARALAHVHAHGVVHRDVKPSNVLLAPDGRALLSDFGVAQLADGTRLTATRATIGTAAYLAPEQVDGGPVTAAADVYALGLVLIEALAGQRPFAGTPSEVLMARMVRDPAIPPDLPRDWRRLLRAMTRRDPAGRPDAVAVATDLTDEPIPHAAAAALRRQGTLAPTRGAARAGSSPPARGAAPPARRPAAMAAPAAAVSARLRPLALVVLVPLVVLAASALTLDRDRTPAASESAGASPTATSVPPTSPATTTATAAPPTTPAPPTTTAPATTATAMAMAPATTTAPATTATAAATAPPAATATPPAPATQAARAPSAACAQLDAQKRAIDQERHRANGTHRHDRQRGDAVRDDLRAQKDAIEAQRAALGC